MPKQFGAEIIGKKYVTEGEVVFKVLGFEVYLKMEVSERYLGILDFDPGKLVAISYRGTLIPNITLKGGVVRLTKVQVKEQVFSSPKAISMALGIEEAMKPYGLR
jgi:hypothetical protein